MNVAQCCYSSKNPVKMFSKTGYAQGHCTKETPFARLINFAYHSEQGVSSFIFHVIDPISITAHGQQTRGFKG